MEGKERESATRRRTTKRPNHLIVFDLLQCGGHYSPAINYEWSRTVPLVSISYTFSSIMSFPSSYYPVLRGFIFQPCKQLLSRTNMWQIIYTAIQNASGKRVAGEPGRKAIVRTFVANKVRHCHDAAFLGCFLVRGKVTCFLPGN